MSSRLDQEAVELKAQLSNICFVPNLSFFQEVIIVGSRQHTPRASLLNQFSHFPFFIEMAMMFKLTHKDVGEFSNYGS